MIPRTIYLNRLIEWKDKQVIKIITGVRRCGKSSILQIFINHLLSTSINQNQIIFINFEDLDFEYLKDYRSLYQYISKLTCNKQRYYIFLDEIQNVDEYQKAVDSLYIKNNLDIYITGSNAFLLSNELATLLSGRYITIPMLPLSFTEYYEAVKQKGYSLETVYRKYVEYGSFPYITALEENKQNITSYLEGLYTSVIVKDIINRNKIDNIRALEDCIRFMFDNIGNTTSAKKISNAMTSAGKKISNHTIDKYLSYLTNAYILYKVGRYDIKGKQYLQTQEKYYLVDIGLRHYLLGSQRSDIGRVLENIVYLELLRRGYEIYIGKIGAVEIDFIAMKDGKIEYYQVAYSVIDNTTFEREIKPLNSIREHGSKFLLTMDNLPMSSYNGIQQIYVLDWLLQN